MAIKSYTEQLEETQAAITSVMMGQAYSISTPTGSRSVTKADLATLEAREKWLRRQVDGEANGGTIRVRGGTPI